MNELHLIRIAITSGEVWFDSSPFEGEYGRIVSKTLGRFVGKRVVVEVREVG